MTFDPATTDSECIGNPVTPLCAAETAQACFMWARPELCGTIGYEPNYPLGLDAYGQLWVYRYRPAGEFVLKDSDIPDWAREQGWRSWRAGDLAYDVWWQRCRPDDTCVVASREDPNRGLGEGCPPDDCRWQPNPATYILRRDGTKWRYVDEFGAYPVQGRIWNRK